MLLEVQLLEESVHKLPHHGNDNQVCVGLLTAAGRAALDFERILETHPQNMSIDSRQQLLAACSNHVELFERAGARLSPTKTLVATWRVVDQKVWQHEVLSLLSG